MVLLPAQTRRLRCDRDGDPSREILPGHPREAVVFGSWRGPFTDPQLLKVSRPNVDRLPGLERLTSTSGPTRWPSAAAGCDRDTSMDAAVDATGSSPVTAHNGSRPAPIPTARSPGRDADTSVCLSPSAICSRRLGKWKRLLQDAGIRDGRLHDARHTAATVLLLLGASERTMMGVMGWSNPAMAQRYAHMAELIRRDIATRVGGLLWGEDPGVSAR